MTKLRSEERVRLLVRDADAERAKHLEERIGEYLHVIPVSREERQRDRSKLDVCLCIEPDSPEEVKALCDPVLEGPFSAVLVALNGDASRDASDYFRAGAGDVLWMPIRVDELALRLRTWLAKSKAERDAKRLRELVALKSSSCSLTGESEVIQRIRSMIARIAPKDNSILITGETGTGKEVTARAVHSASSRKDEPFVSLNLSAIPETLLEAELFGHVAGAFTGAAGERIGQIEHANGGTLFLDEIGDLPLPIQVKLLRVLEERTIRRIGENRDRPVDFRLLTATHKDLDREIDEGRFREDLFYRINTVELHLPPLRDRAGDLDLLAREFLLEAAEAAEINIRISDNFEEALRQHSWPGNVRELKHAMERAIALAEDNDVIEGHHFRRRKRRGSIASLTTRVLEGRETLDEVMADIEYQIINHALSRCDNSQTEAAKRLGIARQTLQGRLKRHRERGD